MWDDEKQFWYETVRKSLFGITGAVVAIVAASTIQFGLEDSKEIRSNQISVQSEIVREYFQHSIKAKNIAFMMAVSPNAHLEQEFENSMIDVESVSKRARIYFSPEMTKKLSDHNILLRSYFVAQSQGAGADALTKLVSNEDATIEAFSIEIQSPAEGTVFDIN